jgi:para-aminobenzoate synthetase component 1
MIVDLLRNDLNTVSERGSVQVDNEGTVVSFPTVHHVVAQISARLRKDLTIGEVLQGLCPAGSISGCPKREVLKGIAEFEQRSRGYLMGHCFYFDDAGHFDSSVLIRTLVGEAHPGGGFQLEYAAGSGITIASDPQQELQEIWDKCRVIIS